MNKLIAVAFLALSLAGCASTSYSPGYGDTYSVATGVDASGKVVWERQNLGSYPSHSGGFKSLATKLPCPAIHC